MRDRPDPDAVSPRAMAWLRSSARGRGTTGGWLPTPPGRPDAVDLAARDERSEPDPVDPVDPVDAVDAVRRRGSARHGVGRRAAGWFRVPATFSGARWQPGRTAVAGALLVTAVAVLVLGLRVAWARSGDGDVVAPGGGARAGPVGVSAGAQPVGVSAGASAEPSPGPGAAPPTGSSGAASPGSSGSPSPGMLVVHVVGRVRHPGVRQLPVGARVADAVEAAGGATSGADLSAVNLARLLVDGEQVRVPRPGELLTAAPAAPGASAGPGAPAPGGSGGAGAAPVSLSTADVAALDTLPGIGPVLAQRIVDWRTENGRFTSVDELAEVSGIGEKLLAQVRPLVVP